MQKRAKCTKFRTALDFDRKYLRNGSKYRNPDNDVIAFDETFCELWPNSNKSGYVKSDLPKPTFSERYISAPMDGAASPIFVCARELPSLASADDMKDRSLPHQFFNNKKNLKLVQNVAY